MGSIKKNAVYNMIKTGSSIIFPLITFPYISRVLMPENVGKYNFGSTYVSYFSLLATLGITTYAIRECSKVKEDKQELGKTASQIYSINIITTMISYMILIITLGCFRRLDCYRNLIVIQSLVILLTTLGADWLNSAMEDFKYITFRTVSFQFLSLILMFLFVKKPDDYLKYAWISVMSSSGANILNMIYRKRYCVLSFTFSVDWKKHLTPILLLFVMLLSQTIFNSADITMLGFIKGDYEVGLYSTSLKITNLISQLFSSILWVVMPRLSFYFAQADYSKINELLRKLLGFLVILGLPCTVGVMILAEDIIMIIAGDSYLGAASILRIMMLAVLFSLFGGSFLGNIILLPSQKEKQYMIICCITAVVNVVANGILIPYFGGNGAAIATALSAFLILVLLLPNVDSQIKIEKIANIIMGPIIGCVMMAIVCVCIIKQCQNLWFRTMLCTCCGACAYAIVLVLTKNEIVYEAFGNLFRKRGN